MVDIKQILHDEIIKNRPNLGISSIKTYLSILSNLNKQMNGDKNLDWFQTDHVKILDYLDKKNDQTKKTTLAALYILTGLKEYQTVMNSIMKKVNDIYKDQKTNTQQEENWISIDEIKTKYNALHLDAISMLNKKKILNENVMMEFLLISFLSGILIPPPRSLDFSELKIRNFEVKIDNYYKSGKLHFNKYKTSKTYGLQIVDLPKELNTILKKWIKINTKDYMIYSTNGKKISCPQITRILNIRIL